MLFSGFKQLEEGMESIAIAGHNIDFEDHSKLLGVHFDSKINFSYHINELCIKAGRQLNALSRLSRKIDFKTRSIVFRSFICSNLDYCAIVWHFCNREDTIKIERIYERGLRIVYKDFDSNYETLLNRSNFPTLELRRQRTIATEVFKALNGLCPPYISKLFTLSNSSTRSNAKNLILPSVRKTFSGLHSFKYFGAKLWNELPDKIKLSRSLKASKNNINQWNGFQCKCNQCK